MNLASLIIDNETAPGSLSMDLVANIGKQVATFGVNGLSRGCVKPDKDNGRIIVNTGGVYRCELFMSLQSTESNLRVTGHIARNGINTHIGFWRNMWNALGAGVIACCDYIVLNKGDTITVNLVSTVSGVFTIDEAQLLVSKM